MPGLGWAGAAAGATDALTRLLTTRRAEFLQNEALKREQAQDRRAQQQLDANLSSQEDARAQGRRDQQLQEAAIALQTADAMGQGAEVSPEAATAIAGTPYAARLDRKATLPTLPTTASAKVMGSQPFADPGGREYAVLRPTAAQMRETGDRTALNAAAQDPTLPPTVRRLVSLRRIGVNLANPESLETPDEREARDARGREQDFADFRRRSTHQAGVAETARQRALADAGTVRPRDRVEALRQADAAAADYLSSLGGDLGVLPEGMDADAIRQAFVDEYLGALDQPTRGRTTARSTARIVDGLRRIVPAPTRSGGPTRGLMGDFPVHRTPLSTVVPLGSPRTGGSSGDPYEQYLARTGAR